MRTPGWRLSLVLLVVNLVAPFRVLSSEVPALELVSTPVAPGGKLQPGVSPKKASAPVPNATLTVTSLADSGAGSLRDTIAAAVAGDTINFSVTGAIDLTSGELVVNKALIIAGPGAASLTVRRSLAAGTPAFRVFEIGTGALVQISGITIANGSADFGAGVHDTVSGGNLRISGCVLTGNQATAAGGALNVTATTTSIIDSTFHGNSAPQGAAYNGENANITVVNSTFTDNGSFALLTWSSSSTASATIINSTIAGNTGNAALWSYQSGGGPGSTVTLLNTLLAQNTPRNAQKVGTGVFVSAGHNLDSDGTTGFVNGVNFDIAGTVANKINARLGSLQNNGGPVPTIPLRISSPALDAGDDTVTGAPQNLTLDARGRPRNADGSGDGVAHVDIGALESQPYIVTNTNDSGANSLRQALLDNEAWGGGLIRFNIPGAGLQTITPLSALPAITRPVTVDGYTQPGSSPNTLAVGNNAVFGIQISGASFPAASAFALNGRDSTVRGFVINGFSAGQGASMGGASSASNWLQGCFLGTNALGTAAVPNLRGTFVASGGKRNVVGTDSDGVNDHGERNLLSGNTNEGIFLQDAGTDGNIVAGNYIGTNAAGTAAISNGFAGVNILSGATNNVIGGTVLAARNVISGNPANAGVVIQTASSTGNLVIGNFIGVDAAGTGPIPNVRGVWELNVPQSRIGGATAGESNVIAFNTLQGVLVTSGNSNTVQGNSIFSNGGLGIELASGANNGAVAPVLTSLSGGTVTGTLAGINGETYRVEFFKNASCDPSRVGEGEVYLGSTNTVPAGGAGSYSAGFAPDVSRPYITATATRVSTGDTSAFSACIPYGTSTAVTSSLNPAPFGATVTFTATVSNLVAGPTPSGSVQFVVDGTPLPPVATAGGLATLTTSSLLIGNHTVTANFSSAVGFASSSGSLAGGETINKASTTLSGLTDSPDPSVAGQPYTVGFILNVTAPGAGTPTGTVSVSDGSGGTCTAVLPATSCSLTSPTFGPKTLTFSYSGDANFNTSVNQAGHQVNKASTTTTITSDPPDPSVVGQSVPVGVSVVANAPGAGTPTGNVTISNGTDICVTTVAVGSCALTFMNTGGYTLTATYAGDSNFLGGTSAGEPHTVNKVDTTTTILSDNPDPSNVGQNVTVTWSVTVNPPGAIGLSGSVTVTDGVNSCLSGVGGSCSLALTTAGARTLTATYSGDSKANGSTSAGVPHLVNLADTTTTITAHSPDPSVTGQAYTVTAGVAVVPPGSGTPTGTVTVSDGTGETCLINLPATTCSLTSTTAGAKTLTAIYGGDAGFNGSTSAGVNHTVNQASTVLSGVSSAPEPSVIGQNYSVSFNLNVTPPGAGTPTGAVMVTDGTGGSCMATLPATSCSLPSSVVGARSLSVTYGGDSNFNGSNASGSHTVNPATTTTVIVSDLPDPSFIGQVVAVNYTVTANAPGSGTPTGTVTVSDGVNSCTGTVAAGTCGVALTTQGFRSLTASYVGTNETQAVTVGGAGGTFTLTFSGQSTPALAFNASAASVQTALQSLSTVGAGNVTVMRVAGVYTVIFGGVLAGNTQPLMTASGAGGATASVAAANPFAPSTSAIEPHSVATPPTIAKAFSPAQVLLNQVTTLTITITNPAANPIGLTGIGVTDTFPAGVQVAGAPGSTNTCGGVFAPVAGATSVSLTGGVLAAPGASCSVSVAVLATTSGVKTNVTGNVTSTEGGTGGTATATLNVIPEPTAVVSGSAIICAGQSTTISAALTGATPWTVTWSDGFVQTVATSPATRSVSPTFTITYTVTSLTDANYSNVTTGLTGQAAITVKPTPSSVITSAASVCFNSTGNAGSVPDAGPGATYLWSVTGGSATSALNGTSITFTAEATGNVILTATVSLNGCPSTSTKTVPIVQTPVAPVPTAPADGSTYQGGHVSWSHPGDASYDVYFDTVNPPARYLVTGLVNNFDAGIPVWFSGVTYYWQVVARNACGSASSAVQSFTAGDCAWTGQAPALLMPIANATNQNTATTLVWTSVPGAARYDLYLGTSSANVALYRSIPSPQLSATVSLAGGKTYYWKVVATPVCGASGSASSAVQSFTTAGNGFTLTSVTPGFVNRWESGQELSFTGSGFLATSRLFTDYRETEAGTLVPSVFLNSFSTSTNLFETLTPDAQAPAARYDVGVTNAGIEEGRLLQSLVVRTFTDVTENDWFFELSGRIADIGVMEQDIDSSASGPQFWPNTAVTRAQMAEYLAKGYQWWRTRSTALSAASCTTPDFPDVPCSHPDWLAIHWIKTWGVTTGAPCASGGGNCYYPNNNLTRAEMLTFLERLRQATVLGSLLSTVGQTDPGCSQPYPGCVGWIDLPGGTTVQWPRAEFNVAYADRLTSGCGGTLGSLDGCPNDFVTRAQIGAFLARLLGLVPTP